MSKVKLSKPIREKIEQTDGNVKSNQVNVITDEYELTIYECVTISPQEVVRKYYMKTYKKKSKRENSDCIYSSNIHLAIYKSECKGESSLKKIKVPFMKKEIKDATDIYKYIMGSNTDKELARLVFKDILICCPEVL